jgi:hypothetical protein
MSARPTVRAVVLLADNRQLMGGLRWAALFLVVWGAAFAGGPLSMIASNPDSMRKHGMAVFLFIVPGLAAFFGGLYLLLRRRHVRFEPARRLVEITRSFLGDETVERKPLAAFGRVSLEARRGSKGGITWALALRGRDELSLGDQFRDHGDAVDAGLRAAAVTGLPLDECDEDGNVVRLRAEQAAALVAEHAEQTDERPWWHRPSALALVAANLVPLAGVLGWDWEIGPLMMLFWLENLIVGAYTVARMALARKDPLAKFALIPFFVFHFGGFCTVHGIFVAFMFGPSGPRIGPDSLPGLLSEALFRHGLLLAALALAVSHGVSFVTNYLRTRDYETASARDLMFVPYKRVIVLHVVILIGGFLADTLGAPLIALVLLIALKMAIDLGAHLTEHRAPLLRQYQELAESAGVAVVPRIESVKAEDINDRPLSHYLGVWRLAPGENAPPGWFATIHLQQAKGRIAVRLTSQPGGVHADVLESATVRGDAARIEWIEVRLRGGGPGRTTTRILRFTAPGAGGERLDLSEVQQPEGRPGAMQAKSFSLVRESATRAA